MLSMDRIGAQLGDLILKNNCETSSIIECVFNRPHKYFVRNVVCQEAAEVGAGASTSDPARSNVFPRAGLGLHIGADVVVIEYDEKDELKQEQIALADVVGCRYIPDDEKAPKNKKSLKYQEHLFRRGTWNWKLKQFRPAPTNNSIGVILLYVYSQDPLARTSRGCHKYLIRKRCIYEIRFVPPQRPEETSAADYSAHIVALRIAAEGFAAEIIRRNRSINYDSRMSYSVVVALLLP